MRALTACLAGALLAALAVSAAPDAAHARREAWLTNGASVTWQSTLGWHQVIRIAEPGERLAANGARGGAILFRGWRYGDRLYGRARTFRAGCPEPFAYRVRGLVSRDGTRAVLQGLSPVIENCRVVDWRAFGRETTLVLIKGDLKI